MARPDKWQEKAIEGAAVHGYKVEELPEGLLTRGPIGPILRVLTGAAPHLTDGAGNPKPLRVQLALKAHQ